MDHLFQNLNCDTLFSFLGVFFSLRTARGRTRLCPFLTSRTWRKRGRCGAKTCLGQMTSELLRWRTCRFYSSSIVLHAKGGTRSLCVGVHLSVHSICAPCTSVPWGIHRIYLSSNCPVYRCSVDARNTLKKID